MQIMETTLSLSFHSLAALRTFVSEEGERFCFFDIETTGLSAHVSSLYLIGALWHDETDGSFHTKQWFADDYVSEKELITSFTHFLSDFTTLVHYNGSGFDIPYIEKKCISLELPSPFETIKSLDIFREIRSLKPMFDVPNLKLPTVEKLCGFLRTDHLTGKDCIQVYSSFMQKKYFRDAEMETEREKLLLHNKEDIIGTYLSAQILAYKCPGSFERLEPSDSTVLVSFSSPVSFPFPVEREIPLDALTVTVRFEEKQIQLCLPLMQGTLYHYFSDYKNYYYLPAEDTAIHKSVGAYVDASFREPAKASNCHTKKNGIFLPLPDGVCEEDRILFRSAYRSKQNYLLWDEQAKQDSSLMEEILIFFVHGVRHPR